MSTDNQDNQLEYNDGLGDLLREKEEYEFSWAKTSIVLISVIAIIFLGLTFVFKISKSYLTNSMMTYNEQPSETSQDMALDKENAALIKLVEDSKTESIPIASLDILHQDNSVQTTFEIKPEAKQSISVEPLQKVSKESTVKYTTVSGKYRYKVISGTFANRVNANAQKNRLKKKSCASYVWTEMKESGRTFYKVQAGAFDQYSLALKQKAKLKRKGFDSYILIK
ncbi:hypothetical protein DID80_02755 [Candidatus Marinamargulisbacteria bacterium SCGC AAA071-K20]|nr:hypothetical protein DID80_02755 [Candidatus Marinamargulisbacteria bacterium SCGC AAA071-K20]